MLVDPGGGGGTPVMADTLIARQVEVATQQAAQIQTSAKNLAAAAGKGFHLEPGAAATLINACRDALDQLTQLQFHLDQVSEAPQLGQTPGAKVVAPFTKDAATDPHGIRPAIMNLQSTLKDMIQAYTKASTNYAETEALVADAMKKEHAKLQPMQAPMLNT